MKTMLITGGARGIGAQMVRHFAAQGWRVMFCYQSSQEKAETLARETGALAVRCDVRDEAQVRAMLAQAMASLRHLDALICNAGAAWTGLTEEMPLAEYQRICDTNLRGAFLCTREALPHLRDTRGAIVLISSMWGLVGASCETVYSATKAALQCMARSLAKEVGPSGVRVNCVAPGGMVTPGAIFNNTTTAELYGPEWTRYVTEYGAGVPVAPNPDEIARMILTLCTPVSDFMYGQTVEVDGGSQFSFQDKPWSYTMEGGLHA